MYRSRLDAYDLSPFYVEIISCDFLKNVSSSECIDPIWMPAIGVLLFMLRLYPAISLKKRIVI